MLLAALDFNIVATAVPIISSEFNAYNNSSWLGTGFLISFTLVLPLYSKIGDIFGRRNMFMLGTLVFILGSGLCGGSKSMNMLVWSRVIQGIGGGGIYGLVNVSYLPERGRSVSDVLRSSLPTSFPSAMWESTSPLPGLFRPLLMWPALFLEERSLSRSSSHMTLHKELGQV
jgi:MFS family permease